MPSPEPHKKWTDGEQGIPIFPTDYSLEDFPFFTGKITLTNGTRTTDLGDILERNACWRLELRWGKEVLEGFFLKIKRK